MVRYLKRIIRWIYWIGYGFPLQVYSLLGNKQLYTADSYYPELERKPKFSILIDQIRHIWKFHIPEEYYFLYGLDIKNFRNKNEFLDYGLLMRQRDYLNTHAFGYENYSYTGILRDKFYFSAFMEQFGFEVPRTYGLIDNGRLYSSDKKGIIPLEAILGWDCDLVVKPLNGIGGVGIFRLKVTGGNLYLNGEQSTLEEFSKLTCSERFLLQERIREQHPLMDSLYRKSINTLRITTVRDFKTNTIHVLGCMLLMGARDAMVSNWHYGGVIINVDLQGNLDKYGYSLYEKKITSHPETKIVFEDFKVPLFDKALNQAIEAHKMFYGLHSIGWDFAILKDKVVFIEGNDDWGMAAHQMVSGGIVPFFDKYFYLPKR